MDGAFQKTKAKIKTVNAVDLFCGAGGTSTGLVHAVNDLGYEIKLTAINHWDVAIATHSKNHEDVAHYCQSIDTIDPAKIVPGGRLQLLVASPECTHHSRARGGKPRSDQKRADAWLLMRWIEKLYVENILIENVKEFQEWGPLTAAGKPDKRHKGMYFQQFLAALRVNYNVEYRILNCADYGDPTTRERLFILARRGHKKIVWPERTHVSRKEIAKMAVQADLFGDSKKDLKPWVAAREIIDWSLEGKSIFGRKKPLSENTMRRIYAGLMKYSLKPFIVPQFSGANPKGVDDPLGTITTTSRGIGFAEPFLVNLKNKDRRDRDINEPTFTQATANHQAVVEVEPFTLTVDQPATNRSLPRSLEEPVATITGSPRIGIVEPFIVSAAHGGNTNPPRDIDEPLGSVLGSPKHAVVEPFLIKSFGNGDEAKYRAKSIDDPLGTVLASRNHHVLVEPFVVNMKGKSNARSVEDPTFTQTNKQHQYLAEPFIVPFFGEREGQEPRTRDINEPAPTVTTNNRMGLCEPYIVKFYGNEKGAESIDDPLDTVTAKDRFGLCIPSIGAVLDIRFRMLQPHELAAAMSFPKDYEFTGNRENKVKQIGNAVPLKTAKALCKALLG